MLARPRTTKCRFTLFVTSLSIEGKVMIDAGDCLLTPRLQLRPLQPGDVASLYAIQRNPEAMRYTHCARSLDDCVARLQAFEDSRAVNGFAPWVVLDRAGDRVIGWGGLAVDPFDPGWGTELLYFFDPACWGRGHATELVSAALDHAFGPLALAEVDAYAMAENQASIRVLQKCGFAFLRHEPALARQRYRASQPVAASDAG
jgi:ribosomal-protein-alanine N-acetyltransferase